MLYVYMDFQKAVYGYGVLGKNYLQNLIKQFDYVVKKQSYYQSAFSMEIFFPLKFPSINI